MLAVAFLMLLFGATLVYVGLRGVSLPHELLRVFGGAS